MPALRTSHETNASAPYVIPNPKNEYWGNDGDGTITRPIAPTQWQSHSQLPTSAPGVSRTGEIPRPGPHRLLGHHWPSTSNDFNGDIQPGGNIGRGQGRGKGKNRVVPYTRVGKGRTPNLKVVDIKIESKSPSPESTDINIKDSHHYNRRPEPMNQPDVLEEHDIKIEPDIDDEVAPVLVNQHIHDHDRPGSLSDL
jgi:hypothetical protein